MISTDLKLKSVVRKACTILQSNDLHLLCLYWLCECVRVYACIHVCDSSKFDIFPNRTDCYDSVFVNETHEQWQLQPQLSMYFILPFNNSFGWYIASTSYVCHTECVHVCIVHFIRKKPLSLYENLLSFNFLSHNLQQVRCALIH